jgi:hypothetical protein
VHASVFEPLIENRFGKKLMLQMARRKGREIEIPCNLLMASDGRVIAREFGMKSSDDHEAAAQAASADKTDPVARAEAGETLSLWGKQPGEEFAAAMAGGVLNQI